MFLFTLSLDLICCGLAVSASGLGDLSLVCFALPWVRLHFDYVDLVCFVTLLVICCLMWFFWGCFCWLHLVF